MKRAGTNRNNSGKQQAFGGRKAAGIKGFALLLTLALTLTAVLPAGSAAGALTVYAAEEESIPPQDAEASEFPPADEVVEEETEEEEDRTLPEEETETEEETVTDDATETEEERTEEDVTLPAQEEVTVEDIVPDVPGEEQEGAGEEETVEQIEAEDELPVSEEALGNIWGDAYKEKSLYYATFIVSIDGEQKRWSTCVTNLKKAGSPMGLTGSAALGADNVEWPGDDKYGAVKAAAEKFVTDRDGELVGWYVYTDGFATTDRTSYEMGNSNCVILMKDMMTYQNVNNVDKSFEVHGNRDYLFVAQVTKKVSADISVTAVPAVTYDGRQHVMIGSKINAKNQSADLRMEVYHSDGTRLTAGKDYSVSYKNNTKASMKITHKPQNPADTTDGKYVPLWSNGENGKRPQMIIKGKGKYKGFTATVYFDILPQNLGSSETRRDSVSREYSTLAYYMPYTFTLAERAVLVKAPDTTYTLKNGKLSKKISTKVTKTYQTSLYDEQGKVKNYSTTVTLKQGTDYIYEVYQLEQIGYYPNWKKTSWSDPNKITEAGDYLLVLRGTGNYCGALYSETGSDVYNDELDNRFDPENTSMTPSFDLGDAYQFRVTQEKVEYDISRATVSIKNKTLNYDGNVRFNDSTIDDFKITVKMGNKELTRGTDYSIRLIPLYDTPYPGQVRGANVYRVSVRGAGGYYYGQHDKNTVTIKGIKLTASMFSYPKTSYFHEGEPSLVPSAAGDKQHLTLTGSWINPYYVRKVVNKDYNSGALASMPTKMDFVIRGSECGEAIDRTAVLKLSCQLKALSLKDAVKRGLISFESSGTSPAEYGAKGVVPGKITIGTGTMSGLFLNGSGGKKEKTVNIPQNGGSALVSFYDGSGKFVGDLQLTFRTNTTGINQKAIINVSAKGMFSGSSSFDGPIVGLKYVTSIEGCNALSEIKAPAEGNVYAVITDAKQSKDSAANQKKLSKPAVKLYECYREKNGQLKYAAIPADEYRVEQDGVAYPGSTTAAYVKIFSGKEKKYWLPAAGVEVTGAKVTFALYKEKVSANKVTKVQWQMGSAIIERGKGQRPEFNFTGSQIRPLIPTITVGSVTLKNGYDYEIVSYGQNTKAGKNTGSVTVRFKYNTDTYLYGGSLTLKFDIKAANASM